MSLGLLDVVEARKSFGRLRAVYGVSLSVEPGQITMLIGPNGAGKTTLFNSIAGRIRLDGGSISFRGHRIDSLPSHEIAQLGISRTFQLTRVFTKMSVLDNVRVAGQKHPGERLVSLFGWMPGARRREHLIDKRARELLKLVHLGHLANEYAGALSGGQRKLLEFARVLMPEPALVLMDEPMAGVNRVLGGELIDHVLRTRDLFGTTFVIIEHDMDVVMTVSDRVVVMHEGRIIADGSPSAVQATPGVIEAYLGTPSAGAKRSIS